MAHTSTSNIVIIIIASEKVFVVVSVQLIANQRVSEMDSVRKRSKLMLFLYVCLINTVGLWACMLWVIHTCSSVKLE